MIPRNTEFKTGTMLDSYCANRLKLPVGRLRKIVILDIENNVENRSHFLIII